MSFFKKIFSYCFVNIVEVVFISYADVTGCKYHLDKSHESISKDCLFSFEALPLFPQFTQRAVDKTK